MPPGPQAAAPQLTWWYGALHDIPPMESFGTILLVFIRKPKVLLNGPLEASNSPSPGIPPPTSITAGPPLVQCGMDHTNAVSPVCGLRYLHTYSLGSSMFTVWMWGAR